MNTKYLFMVGQKKLKILKGKYVVKLENETSEFTSEACDSLLNAYKEAFKWYGEYLLEKDKKLKAEMHSRLV